MLQQVTIRDVRNLQPVDLEPGDRFNLFSGSNGSGKTSLLEAISVLGSGRSFRASSLDRVINYSGSELVVFGQVSTLQGIHRLGFSKARGGPALARVDGRTVRSGSDYAAVLPLLSVVPDLGELVSGEPGIRRRFLDWGAFHGRPGFGDAAAAFRRNLGQRNASLKSGKPQDARFFDPGLVAAATQVNALRSAWFGSFREHFLDIGRKFATPGGLSIDYRPGWDQEVGLEAVLESAFEGDAKRGFTRFGPQRADIAVKFDGRRAGDVLSRGQCKIISFCLLAAQARLLEIDTGTRPVVLVDDLASELDGNHRRLALDTLVDLRVQVFLADVAGEMIRREAGQVLGADVAWFHVEHGTVTPRCD